MTTTYSAFIDMKTHFNKRDIPPVSADQLRSVGIKPDDLWWSPTFHSWVFSGPLVQLHPYSSTGMIIHILGLTPNPDA